MSQLSYYIPRPEDFYLGFEYDRVLYTRLVERGVESCVYNTLSFERFFILNGDCMSNFRVPYLTREAAADEGFACYSISGDESERDSFCGDTSQHLGVSYTIWFYQKTENSEPRLKLYKKIETSPGIKEIIGLYNGTCRCKNDFRRILVPCGVVPADKYPKGHVYTAKKDDRYIRTWATRSPGDEWIKSE